MFDGQSCGSQSASWRHNQTRAEATLGATCDGGQGVPGQEEEVLSVASNVESIWLEEYGSM